MLKQRIMTVLWLLPLVIGAIFFLPAEYFAWALVPVFMIGAKEWGSFIDPQCTVTQWTFTVTVSLILIALNIFVPVEALWLKGQVHPIFLAVISIGLFWWVISTLLVFTYPKSGSIWQASPMLKSMFGQLTLIPCFVSLITLKSISANVDPYFGGTLVFLVMLIVWAADTGAYFAGRSLGKHKLMPKVSPNKTLEGLGGGLVATMAVVAGVMYYSPEQELGLVIAVTLITAIASAFGDLSESMFKRAANIKDSGKILPGHGGVLDRMDSLTAALPVFTFIYLAFWI
ncbi:MULTISPECIES: phosphatidate cytidylyltransferase [Shewanella]|uniref:Phosphatidate cytidylyltransferase n=1 Tax=Shewanella japonica TaxID=93973 RepID=A0ABN4YHS7_9GAMM|nr:MULTISPECIES: phosphatidate cytidylyltransferase [Shewanella]ARD21730.1 Phosphatidate cytidylyltransferase [Shewanella japonica]KPZ72897.1 Phosphatidate cytidylyltransferase [Shewanella sp. P1-14-1]